MHKYFLCKPYFFNYFQDKISVLVDIYLFISIYISKEKKMIFKVSSKVKSSLALNTLKCSYDAGSSVLIDEKDLYAADIRAAIDRGLLVPSDIHACDKILKESSRVEIINPTDKVMVLGASILRPNGSLTVSREMLQEDFIRRALESGHVILKEDKKVAKNKITKNKITKNKVQKIVEEDIIEKEEKVLLEKMKEKMASEEKPTTSVVWNLRTQEIEEAKSVDKNKTPIKVEADNKKPIKKAKKKSKKKTKKKAKKKATKKFAKKSTKKKDNKPISKKDRIISPSGEKRLAKTAADAAVELDSRGNPLNKASDALNHLIDDLSSNQIGFVDEEQKQDRFNKRDF